MDSRLLSKLNAQASGTRDPVVWAMAVCRAASHFAGHGRTNEALTSIKVVRAQFGKDLHLDIASWLMLAEGVLHYFQAKIPESYDRIRRAYGLAIALRNNSALPSCAAWMAHVEFNDCRYTEMVAHIEEALTKASADDHQAIGRASLVLATAYHIADEYQLSRPWYEKARLNAAAEGDDATVSATLHNMASIRAANVRLEDTFGGDSKKEAHRASLEASSSITYDYAIGHNGLDFLTLMLHGLLLTIDSKYSRALEFFDAIRSNDVPERLRPLIIIDTAWCKVNSGDKPSGWASAMALAESLNYVKDDDDLAYIHSRIRQIALACDEAAVAQRHKVKADEALVRHKHFQADLLEMLNRIRTAPESKNPA